MYLASCRLSGNLRGQINTCPKPLLSAQDLSIVELHTRYVYLLEININKLYMYLTRTLLILKISNLYLPLIFATIFDALKSLFLTISFTEHRSFTIETDSILEHIILLELNYLCDFNQPKLFCI